MLNKEGAPYCWKTSLISSSLCEEQSFHLAHSKLHITETSQTLNDMWQK
jgi:1,2-phenylacetyl-CoA epoxidase catalytic subunit